MFIMSPAIVAFERYGVSCCTPSCASARKCHIISTSDRSVIISHYAQNAAHAGVSAAGDDAEYAAAAHSAEQVDDTATERDSGSIHVRN